MIDQTVCPLCESKQGSLFHRDNNRRSQRLYIRCQRCALVYVPSEFYLAEQDEKAEYDRHDNNLEDEGYQGFLNRLWCELKPLLEAQQCQQVLDFGCGPGPLLAKMMIEDGFKVSVFDHFYANEPSVLRSGFYDAITSTEVIEHLHQPKQVIEQWLDMLKMGGYLGLMTKRVTSQSAFANWHYKNDLTHVCFYSETCFRWIAEHYNLKLSLFGNDVTILQKR